MLPTSNIAELMPQKDLASNNKIAKGHLSSKPGSLSVDTQRAVRALRGRLHPALPVEGATQAPIIGSQDTTLDDQFKKVISDLLGHDKNDKNDKTDQQAGIIFSPLILEVQDQKTTAFQSNTLLSRHISESHISSDLIMQGKPEPVEENPQRNSGKALVNLPFIKNLPSEQREREGEASWALPVEGATQAPLIEETSLISTDPKDEKCLPCSHNNHAQEEAGSHILSPSKSSAQDGGGFSQQLLFETKQVGEGGDVKNKPGLEKELKLLFSYEVGDGGDFSNVLTNSTNRVHDKIVMDSHININDMQSSNEIQNIFLQKAAHFVKQDVDSITLNIDRDDLGKLKLDISIRDNMVKAEIVTEYPRVKEMIELNQGQLRDALSDHGLAMSYLSVSVEGGHSDSLNYQDIMANSSAACDSHNIQIPEEDNNLVRYDCYQSDNSINIFA